MQRRRFAEAAIIKTALWGLYENADKLQYGSGEITSETIK